MKNTHGDETQSQRHVIWFPHWNSELFKKAKLQCNNEKTQVKHVCGKLLIVMPMFLVMKMKITLMKKQ